MTGFCGATYSTVLEVHLEDGKHVLRVGSKQMTGSTGGENMNVQYYKYKVYCSRDILVTCFKQHSSRICLYSENHVVVQEACAPCSR